MLTRDQERDLTVKQGIEYFVLKYFANWQKKVYANSYDFVRFGEPPEPDILAYHNDGEKWIEVGILYSGDFDAARLLGRIIDEDYKDKLQEEAMVPLERVYIRLAELIKSKQQTCYSANKTLLLICNAFPLFYREDFLCVENTYDCGQFSEVWLVCDRRGNSGILQLDKLKK